MTAPRRQTPVNKFERKVAQNHGLRNFQANQTLSLLHRQQHSILSGSPQESIIAKYAREARVASKNPRPRVIDKVLTARTFQTLPQRLSIMNTVCLKSSPQIFSELRGIGKTM